MPSRIRALVTLLAIVSGLLATIGGPAPTGTPRTDVVLVAFGVGLVIWLGAGALRWDAAIITIVAGLSTATLTGSIVGIGVGLAGFLLPVRPGLRSPVNAALVAIALNLTCRSELDVFLGAATIVSLTIAGYVAAIGFLRRPLRTRRILAVTAGICGAIVFVSGVAFAVLTTLAADDLRAASAATEDGLAALAAGDLPAARAAFAGAAASFSAADQRMDTPFTAAVKAVPVLAQHRRVAVALTDDTADAAAAIAAELGRIDLDTLTVDGGHIDLDAVRAIADPLAVIDARINQLRATVADVDSVWLTQPVATRLGRLNDRLSAQHERSANAVRAASIAPAMLGGNGARTYFIGFTTPAEARGSGGFMGNWAELTTTDGTIEMTRFGRADDLNEAGDPLTRRFPTDEDSGLSQWVARYAPYHIASGPGGTTGPEVWKNINMSPDMAATGKAIAALYPQSGGGQLDGVFIVDVYALSRLLEFTGPIPLPDGYTVDGESAVSADSAADFLLNDQYDVSLDERVDVLEEFSRAVVDALLAGSLPPPNDLVDLLGPMVAQGRVSAWMADPDEHAALAHLGLTGTLPTPGQRDGLAIVFNNAVGNKIDYYLDAKADYRVEASATTGTATAALDIELANNAPLDGEPGYVIGNPIGLPTGTNRTMVSVYSRLPVTAVLLDGRSVTAEPGSEAGYFVTTVFVTLPAGQSGQLHVEMSGPIDVRDGYELVARTPPTVGPTPLHVDATWNGSNGRTATVTQTIGVPGAVHLVTTSASP